jgi:hypothetical protein
MIKMRNFKGMLPKVHPTLLPDGFGITCKNARMKDGALTPYRLSSFVHLFGSDVNAFARVRGDVMLGFADAQARVVPGPVADDRFYICGDGPPRLETYAPDTVRSWALALPGPVLKPTCTVTSGTVDPNLKESIVFAYTWVTSLDEESPPSPLSTALDYSPGMVIQLNAFSTAPSGRGIANKRIYRSVTDYAGNAVLHFVGEIGAAVTDFYYSDADIIAEPIVSTDYDTPVDGLMWFTTMPNGIIAASKGKDLYFCEPYRPHAWPTKYALQTDAKIMGLAAFGSNLAVLTEGTPYLVQGTHPSTMSMTKIEQNLPCLNWLGVVDLGYAAAYPSTDGLVVVSANGANVVTRGMFTREEWEALSPPTFRAGVYEGMYVFLRNGTPGAGIIDLTNENPFYVELELDSYAIFTEVLTGTLLHLDNNLRTVRSFDSSDALNRTFTWRSKRIKLGSAVNFPWARTEADVETDADTVTTSIYGDGGTLIHSYSTIGTPERLPSGRRDETFEIEMVGKARVFNFGLGFDPNDLSG